MAKKIGLQIYSIRDIYSKNPREALQLIKDAGYDAVDFFGGIIMSAEELKKLLDEIGLECCGWHVPWDYFRKDILEAFVAYNKVIGNKYLICPGLPGEYTKNKDAWLKASEKLNEIAAQLKPHGMYTGMHSHAGEFKPTEGTDELPWDIIANNTCEDVVLQIDMGNTEGAGVDSVAALKKHKNRNRTIHLKPYSKTKGYKAPIGEDDLDWADIIKFCKEYGNVDYYIVEYEEEDAKEGVKTCLDNLKKYF